MLLFDRLAQEVPSQAATTDQTVEALKSSIVRELHCLFNTRSHLDFAQYLQSSGSVLDYGVPDFAFLGNPRHSELEAILGLAIQRYEPRLFNAVVKVIPSNAHKELAYVHVSGESRLGNHIQRFEFEIVQDTYSGARKIT